MAFRTAGGKTYTLQSSISSTQTTITLTSFKVPVSGDDFTMALMNTDIAYGTIAPRTSQSEFISFTGITQNADGTATLTGVTRGLNKTSPYTEDTDFKLPHAGASQFILSDAPQVFNQYAALQNDNTWTGRQQFPTGGTASAAIVGATYAAPVLDNEVATKKYIDDIAISGSPDATTTVKGILQLSTQAQLLAKTATGSTGAALAVTPDIMPSTLLSDYKADTGAANAYVITPIPAITAYTAGQIFSFKAANANTTTSTLNVNGLGVKTINKAGGATVLASGDIAAGMIVVVEYDGTNFIMLNPVANAPTTAQLTTDVQIFSTPGSTSWTKPSGAKWVEVTVIGSGGAGGGNSTGGLTGGGGGGGYGVKRFAASALGSTETVLVGAGGTGVAGTSGNAGNPSAFGTTVLLRATGGAGGTSGSAAGGTANGDRYFSGGVGGAANGGAGVDTAVDPSPRGGGAGAYDSGTPTNSKAGGNGGAFITNYVKAGGAGGAAGVNNGVAASATNTGLIYGGVGGGGAGYNGIGTNTGGAGGAGNLGSGGGGAAGPTNAGGAGGDGMVVVVTYF